jgi:putative cofactor-binding repeat protein
MGGAISYVYNNLIVSNQALDAGGGIYSRYDASVIHNNTIFNNSSARGGGIYVLTFSNLPPIIYNSIIWGNTAPLGNSIYLDPAAGSTAEITYCDVQGGWIGTGNINADPIFVTAPFGTYCLSQTIAGQPFQSPCVDAGNPASPMITGTTRTDGAQDAGIVDMGYHYELGLIPPFNLAIELSPLVTPTQIPAGGGTFGYGLSITNNGTIMATFDGWINAILPTGTTVGPLLQRINMILAPAGIISRPNMTQFVPGSAPAGNYTYVGCVGVYPDVVYDSDTLFFEKLAGDRYGLNTNDWELWGWEEGNPISELSPTEFDLLTIYPNPFNCKTTISFELNTASDVELKVYDIAGREITALGTGHWALGKNNVVWEADDIPSGVYFIRLSVVGSQLSVVSGRSVVKKVVLMK